MLPVHVLDVCYVPGLMLGIPQSKVYFVILNTNPVKCDTRLRRSSQRELAETNQTLLSETRTEVAALAGSCGPPFPPRASRLQESMRLSAKTFLKTTVSWCV